jgi:hypothetical protein
MPPTFRGAAEPSHGAVLQPGPGVVQRAELSLSLPTAPRFSASPAATTATPWADPARAAVASGVATMAADGSVVFAAPAGYHSEFAAPSAETTTVLQRQAGDEAAAAPPAPAAPPPAPAAAPAAPAAAGGAPGGQTNEQLEELAKHLYDKIRERLKIELRLDRERSGRLTDMSR